MSNNEYAQLAALYKQGGGASQGGAGGGAAFDDDEEDAGTRRPLVVTFDERDRAEKSGCVSFDAIFIEELLDPSKPKKPTKNKTVSRCLALVPFNIQRLSNQAPGDIPTVTPQGSKDSVPIYVPITRDGAGIAMSILHHQPNAAVAGTRTQINYIPLVPGTKEYNLGIVADGHQIAPSCFIPCNRVLPPPFTVIRVFNFQLKRVPDGKVFVNISGFDAAPHAALNALPVGERIAAVMPATRQLFPLLEPFMPFKKLMREQVDENQVSDKKELLKKRRGLLFEYGAPPLPMVRASINQRWVLGQTAPDFEAPDLLPQHGKSRDGGGLVLIPSWVSERVFTPSEKKEGSPATKPSARLSFNLMAARTGDVKRYVVLTNVTLWDRTLAQFGISQGVLLDAFLYRHPVPMQLVLGTKLEESLFKEANSTPVAERVFAEKDGVIVPGVHGAVVQLAEYAQRRLIPVTKALVGARFKLSSSKKDGKILPTVVEQPDDRLDTLTLPNMFTTFGYECLDVGGRPVPVEGDDDGAAEEEEQEEEGGEDKVVITHEVRYYAAPLFSLPNPLPMGPRADPFMPEFDAAQLPPAVTLSPAEGDVFLAQSFPSGKLPTTKDGWMQPAERGKQALPYFLFFQVAVPTEPVLKERVATFAKFLQQNQMPTGLDAMEWDDLPETMDDWRQKHPVVLPGQQQQQQGTKRAREEETSTSPVKLEAEAPQKPIKRQRLNEEGDAATGGGATAAGSDSEPLIADDDVDMSG